MKKQFFYLVVSIAVCSTSSVFAMSDDQKSEKNRYTKKDKNRIFPLEGVEKSSETSSSEESSSKEWVLRRSSEESSLEELPSEEIRGNPQYLLKRK